MRSLFQTGKDGGVDVSGENEGFHGILHLTECGCNDVFCGAAALDGFQPNWRKT